MSNRNQMSSDNSESDSSLSKNVIAESTRFYALYSHFSNRFIHLQCLQEQEAALHLTSEQSVEDREECTSHYSLSILATNLEADQETELRHSLAQKLNKGSLYSTSSSITLLDLSLSDQASPKTICYFRLLHYLESLPDDSQSEENDSRQEPDNREFVVCFLAAQDEGLDLFQKELDEYSSGLMPLLDVELTELTAGIKVHLENWYDVSIAYIQSCVALVRSSLKHLLYLTLTGASIQLEGGSTQLRQQINRLLQCCSLNELLDCTEDTCTGDTGSLASDTDSLMDLGQANDVANQATMHQPETVTVTITGDTVQVPEQSVTRFCEDWARALSTSDAPNAAFVKRVIESYKLKCIQDMNNLKRLIKQSESDYYALYRSYGFLRQCGNGAILLLYAQQDCQRSHNYEGYTVIQALNQYSQTRDNSCFT